MKTLFPYIGKKPPRIGREVVEAFAQSGCNIFVDLFCGSLAMLCYLPWEIKVVVNDINGNLTNLYFRAYYEKNLLRVSQRNRF